MAASNFLSSQFDSPHDTPYTRESGKLGTSRYDDQFMHIDMPHEEKQFRDVMIGDEDPTETLEQEPVEDPGVRRAKSANKMVAARLRKTFK